MPILLDNQAVSVELIDTPFYAQKAYQCGPAALATLLTASGISLEPDTLVPKVYLPQKKGSHQIDLLAASRRYGRIPYVIDSDLSAIVMELNKGRPVLVFQNIGFRNRPVYHYAVVVGIDLESKHVILRSGKEKRLLMDMGRFVSTWQHADSWGMILLKPGDLPARPDLKRYLVTVAVMETIGRPAEAEIGYRAALLHWPNHPVALFGLVNSLFGQNRYREAEQTYRYLLSFQPENKAVLNNLSETLAEQGYYRKALTIIDQAVEIESKNQDLTETCLKTRAEIIRLRSKENAPHDQ